MSQNRKCLKEDGTVKIYCQVYQKIKTKLNKQNKNKTRKTKTALYKRNELHLVLNNKTNKKKTKNKNKKTTKKPRNFENF